MVSSIAQKGTSSDSERMKLAEEYSVKIEEELDIVCKEVLVYKTKTPTYHVALLLHEKKSYNFNVETQQLYVIVRFFTRGEYSGTWLIQASEM